VPARFEAGRYHSWVVNENDLPSELRITARDDQGMIMALAHTGYDVKGVQFHPESVMTDSGKKILLNWLEI
jgi:anthranilate synthase component 2